jgi:ribosome-binding protein aMBF1 (putative translation factor)
VRLFTPFKQARCVRGLLQVELAQRARIDRWRLSRIENLWLAPTPDELERIAAVLGCPVENLVRHNPPK